MGPKLMNFCKPEPMGTTEHGKMLKRIQTLEDSRIPAKEAKIGVSKDKREESRGRSFRGL